ncbi:MAG: CBS domain-containing protein [Acidobacteriota bacterium]
MGLLRIASVPAATVLPRASVLDAVRVMNEKRVGAVAVAENDKLVGIFTERDLMNRVVLEGRDAKTTPVSEVMTPEPTVAHRGMSYGEALRVMVEHHFRHLPVVDSEARVEGMLSVRHLLQHAVNDLSDQLDSVVNFFTADGPGG